MVFFVYFYVGFCFVFAVFLDGLDASFFVFYFAYASGLGFVAVSDLVG
jgi:hypothetical protein